MRIIGPLTHTLCNETGNDRFEFCQLPTRKARIASSWRENSFSPRGKIQSSQPHKICKPLCRFKPLCRLLDFVFFCFCFFVFLFFCFFVFFYFKILWRLFFKKYLERFNWSKKVSEAFAKILIFCLLQVLQVSICIFFKKNYWPCKFGCRGTSNCLPIKTSGKKFQTASQKLNLVIQEHTKKNMRWCPTDRYGRKENPQIINHWPGYCTVGLLLDNSRR